MIDPLLALSGNIEIISRCTLEGSVSSLRRKKRGVFHAQFHKYFDILESHGQLVVTGWLWERWLRAFLSGVSKTPTRGRG